MTTERIRGWILQFDEADRVFVLEELKNILEKRYISQARGKSFVKEMLQFLAKKFEYDSPKEFLSDSCFIDHQPEGKSQKVLLAFLNGIVQEEYGIAIFKLTPTNAKYHIYFDDVLCTGDTLVKGLTNNKSDSKDWFYKTNETGKTNLESFKENNGKLVLAYFSIHTRNIENARKRIYYGLGKQNVDIVYAREMKYEVENDIDDVKSALNLIFPTEAVRDEKIIECQNQIEDKIKNEGYHENDSIRYREANRPAEEKFFSSADNRNRFEKIILDKCVDIYNSSEKLNSDLRPKPLGYVLNTDLILGFGTLIFTWRNVPFNVPLAFWYKSQHWISLFERKFVTYEH